MSDTGFMKQGNDGCRILCPVVGQRKNRCYNSDIRLNNPKFMIIGGMNL